MGPDGEALKAVRNVDAGPRAGTEAEKRIFGLVGRAARVFDKVLRLGEDGGVPVSELEQYEKAWRLRLGAAEAVLKLAKAGVVRSGAGPKTGGVRKAAVGAETEPEDEGGVPEDCFSHLL